MWHPALRSSVFSEIHIWFWLWMQRLGCIRF
jgi:hypothetical protein